MKKVVSGVVSASIFVFFLSYAINGFNLNRSNFLGLKPVFVASDSMTPALNVGELHLLGKSKNINVGDIVAFEKDNKLILHRVIEESEDYVITQGDNNSKPDGLIFKQDILFKYFI